MKRVENAFPKPTYMHAALSRSLKAPPRAHTRAAFMGDDCGGMRALGAPPSSRSASIICAPIKMDHSGVQDTKTLSARCAHYNIITTLPTLQLDHAHSFPNNARSSRVVRQHRAEVPQPSSQDEWSNRRKVRSFKSLERSPFNKIQFLFSCSYFLSLLLTNKYIFH